MVAERKLYTLTDLSKKSGISMPTLQRYKKLYQKRIPSVGSGRTQKYPEEALAVVKQLKVENLAKRGRPRKKASAKRGGAKPRAAKRAPRKSARKGSAASGELLSLAEVGRLTGISYPTLLRYVKSSLSRLPHVGRGRKRRYRPEAVEVFRELRANSRRGRRKGSGKGKAAAGAAGTRGMERRLRALERSQASLTKEVKRLVAQLKKPLTVTVRR